MGLSTLERTRAVTEYRASPENPTTNLSNPAAWLTESFGASPTTAGVMVNERTALTFASAFACINVVSKDLAQLPIFVYQRDGDARTAARDHNIWRVLHDRPNPMMTPFTFKQALQAHAVSWGNGYAEIEYDNAGEVLNLWPLLPDRTHVTIRDGKKFVVTRIDEYVTAESNSVVNGGVGAPIRSRWVGLPADRVLHVPGLGFDGYRGYSVIHMARNAIGAGMAAEEFTARMFSNGASPRIALASPNKLTPEARLNLKMSWDAAYTGLSNAHRTAVLEEGLTVQKIGLPAKDQELIESSKFSIEQMARFFDIPLMRLHSTTGLTSWGTGLEQWQRAYLTHTLGPWIVQWEETLNWGLFTEKERPLYFAEFLREALLQADHAARATYYKDMFMVGAISPNQIARKENMPTFGKPGDERFIPLNLVPLSVAASLLEDSTRLAGTRDPVPPANPADEGEPGTKPSGNADGATAPDGQRAMTAFEARHLRSARGRQRMQSAYERVYLQVAQRVVGKQVHASRRAVERFAKDDGLGAAHALATFQTWVRDFFDGERAAMEAAYLPATHSLGDMMAGDVLAELGRDESESMITRAVEQFARLYVEALAAREIGSSIGQLVGIAQAGTTADGTAIERLNQRLDSWETSRPEQIAMREPVQAGNAIARHVYQESGIQRLQWISPDGGCELCQSMHGRIVSIARPFLTDGESTGSGDKSITATGSVSNPPLHKGCVCQIVAA